MLETLQQANLFVIPLDNKRRWYRYHHLFAEFLHNQLQHRLDLRSDEQVSPKNREYLAQLHHRASHWYAQNGFTAEAIEHGLAAGDSNQVATLLEEHADQLLWQSGHIPALLRWLDVLPEMMVRVRPRLAITKATILAESLTEAPETVEGLLQAAETILQAEGRSGDAPAENDSNNRQALLTELDIVRASLARYQGDIARSINFIRQALERVPQDNAFLRDGATQMLAIAQSSLGQMGEARRIFAGALKINQAAGNSYNLTLATAYLIEVLTVQGQLQQAKQVFREVLPAIGQRHSPDVGMVYINIGEVFREWDQLGTAEHYLRQGIELCQPFEPFAAMVVTGHITLARLLQAQGNLAGALNLLRSVPPLRESDTIYYPSARLAAYQARLWLAQGNPTAATYWAQNNSLRVEDTPGDYRYEIDYLTLARILMAQQHFDEATVLLGRLQQAAEAGERMGRVIEILMLRALAYQAQNKFDQALTDLKQALLLAEPEGYIRLFIDEGEPVAQLLRQAVSRGIMVDYAGKLLAAFLAGARVQGSRGEADKDSPLLPCSYRAAE
jgi:LuxR family maltose regulon positive regulatory protein